MSLRRVFPPLSLLAALSLLNGCKEATPEPDVTRSWIGSELHPLRRASPSLHIVVVDDSDTDRARALRAFVRNDSLDIASRSDLANCGIEPDPVALNSIDRGYILVPASRPELALHPGNTPELLARGDDRSKPEPLFNRAIEAAFERLPLNASGTKPYLDAIAHWLDLLAGEREPTNIEEYVLLESYEDSRDRTWVSIVLGSEAVDDSRIASSLLRPSERLGDSNFTFGHGAHIVWSLPGGTSCEPYAGGPNALPEGIPGPLARIFSGPCSQAVVGLMVEEPRTHCPTSMCVGPIARRANGQRECVLSALIAASESCENSGYKPVDSSSIVYPYGIPHRRCEIPQLEGDELRRCERLYDYEPGLRGFCLRERFSSARGAPIEERTACLNEEDVSEAQVRFTQGADLSRGLWKLWCAPE